MNHPNLEFLPLPIKVSRTPLMIPEVFHCLILGQKLIETYATSFPQTFYLLYYHIYLESYALDDDLNLSSS